LAMLPLETDRLIVQPFITEDLEDVHRILDVELAFGPEAAGRYTLAQTRSWLRWTVMNYQELARLFQPPYGDRAIVLKATGQLVGACGFVPLLEPFERLPYFTALGYPSSCLNTTEFGLFYALSPFSSAQWVRHGGSEGHDNLCVRAAGGSACCGRDHP